MFDTSKLEKIKTPEDLRVDADSRQALAYLASTDWYSLRFIEESTPVPEAILAARALARSKVIA